MNVMLNVSMCLYIHIYISMNDIIYHTSPCISFKDDNSFLHHACIHNGKLYDWKYVF